MSKMKKPILFYVGGGSLLSATEAINIVSQSPVKENKAFEKEPIVLTNTYEGLNEWIRIKPIGTKSRKCSNKKYVKRKKARNGKR